MQLPRSFVWCWLVLAGSFSLQAQEQLAADQVEFFESRIRPVLVEHCYECHSAEANELQGGLRVDTPTGLRTGGDSGPAVVPGMVSDSLLIAALKHDGFEMPPQGKLPPEVIAHFTTWIEQGAVDPRPDEPNTLIKSQGIDLESGRQFWAFQPPRTTIPPTVQQADWVRDPVDQFLLAKIEAAGLAPASDATKAELLRRLSFDLIGLPPTVEELDAFLQDDSATAVDTVADRLLASPRFGERWGRHWLDVARYSDSTGGGRSMLYGESWYYRNYVIRAFQDDKPLDRFLIEQIAGDMLPANDLQQQRDLIAATAFLALGPTNYEMQDKKQLRMEVVDEQLDTIGKSVLAMTIGCARCHDHKFDPIPQSDYYALAGFFRNTQTLIDDNVSTWVKRPWPLDPEKAAQVALDQAAIAKQKARVGELKGELEALQKPSGQEPEGILIDEDEATLTGNWTESTSVKPFVGRGYRHSTEPAATAVFSKTVTPGQYAVYLASTPGANRCENTLVRIEHAEGVAEKRVDQRPQPSHGRYFPVGTYSFGEQVRITLSGQDKAEGVMIADGLLLVPQTNDAAADSPAPTAEAVEALVKQAKEAVATAEAQLKELEKAAYKVPQLPSVKDWETIEDCPLYIRGNLKTPGKPVQRGFLSVATPEPLPDFPTNNSGRLQLAEWLASPQNPLTARVYVNRVWSKLFGQGIVRTVDNFGAPGERPSHPELLDQLALDFVADGWSTKRLIRRLVLTHAYRLQTNSRNPDADVDNRLLSAQNRIRLDAECLHDALLQLSGELKFDPVTDAVRSGTNSEYGYQFDVGSRAVYLPIFRNQLPDLFAAFDFANPNLPTAQRNTSTLSTQALLMLNSPFVQERSQRTAERLLALEISDDERLEQLSLEALSRQPTPTELSLLREFLDEEQRLGTPRDAAWSRVVQTILASLDFRYR